MKPLISLIVPVYNVENYIERCLLSLIGQTYSNIEIIIVNDGSTDGSIVIAETLATRDKRVRLINQHNLGLGEARNTGIRNCKGDFAVFIDSDDWIEDRMIELLVNSAMLSNAEIVCCGFNEIRENERYSYFQNTELNWENDYIALCLNEVHKNKKKVITTVWAKLFKLSLLRDYSILFNLSTFEDSPFFFKAVYYSNKISFIKEPLYNYFVRKGSITNSPISESKVRCFYQADDLILSFLKEKGIYTAYKREFDSFHFLRIVLYGGCKSLYWEDQGYRHAESYLIFMKYLMSQEAFLIRFTPNNSLEMKLFRVLRIGLFLGRFNFKLSNMLFRVAAMWLKIN